MNGSLVLQEKPLILLVEDDEVLRGLLSLLLSSHGYEPLATHPDTDVVELWRKFKSKISVVIVGYVLDTRTRVRLFEMFIHQRPDLKIILVSGYDRSQITHVIDLENCWFLKKPFQNETLLQLVEKIIDRQRCSNTAKPPCPGNA